MSKFETKLKPGKVYHIWAHAINNENLFLHDDNYHFFLSRYEYYIHSICKTYAYCLLSNHLHLMVELKPITDSTKVDYPKFFSQRFSNLFNSYAKSFNNVHNRKGTLFMRPFNRAQVIKDQHFTSLIAYIHLNPVKHGFVNHPSSWPYSSYSAYLSKKPTRLSREVALNWFGNKQQYLKFHNEFRLELFEQKFDNNQT